MYQPGGVRFGWWDCYPDGCGRSAADAEVDQSLFAVEGVGGDSVADEGRGCRQGRLDASTSQQSLDREASLRQRGPAATPHRPFGPVDGDHLPVSNGVGRPDCGDDRRDAVLPRDDRGMRERSTRVGDEASDQRKDYRP